MFNRIISTVTVCLVIAGTSLMAHDPHDPIITVAVSPNFAQDSTVFAATDYLSVKLGVYALLKSTNGGVTWSAVAGLPNVKEMWAIDFSPGYAQDQTVFVAGLGGLFTTTNGGTTWTEASTLSLQNMVLSANFATDNTLFVVTTVKTIYKSTDRGQTFTQLTTPASLTSALNTIAVSPNFANDGTLLLGSASNGIFESTNGGASWVSVFATTSSVNSLVFSPAFITDRAAFAGTYAGLLISADGGATWNASNSGLTDTNVNTITLSPGYLQDSTMWVATAVGGVFQSNNQGSTWTVTPLINRQLSDLTTSHYHNVAAAFGSSGISLILATFEGMWTSASNPISWQYVDTMPTRLIRHILLSPNFATDQTIFASTYGGGNLWSTAGGASWVFMNSGMHSPYTDGTAMSPNFGADGTAFSSIYGYLERSVDRGATWQLMNAVNGTPTNARGVAVSPNFAQDQTVLIGIDIDPNPTLPLYVTYQGKQYPNQGMFLSTDGGNNWAPTSLSGPPVVAVAVSPAFATDKTAFAGTANKGMYKSTDGGMTWTQLTMPTAAITQIGVVVISPNYANDQTVYVAPVTGGLLKSTNGGSSWTVLARTANLLIMDIQLSPNYAIDKTFYAATIQGGVMKSINGGISIVPQASFPDQFVTAVALSPNYSTDQTVFAAAYHSIYKSKDGGTTWTDTIEPGRIEETRSAIPGAVGQPPPTITYQGTWTSTSSTSASTSAYMATSTSQNTAVLNFTGTGIRWISMTGPTQGTATVTVDGVSQGTITLTRPHLATAYQQTVWQQLGMPCAPHVVTITATPKVLQTVTLDAFDVWIDACPEAKPNVP